MGRLKELKYLTLVMLLFGFVATASLSSCRETKKEDKTEQQEEQMTEDESVHEEHPTEGGDEHPKTEGDEHPTDSDPE